MPEPLPSRDQGHSPAPVLGIMGGTFDPIHLGHLQIAQLALHQLGLKSVLFLPDGDPPHKAPISSPEDRLRMVELAIRGEPRFEVSDLELRRSGRTYTVDTLLQLTALRPREELCYLVGSDTFFLFPTWRTAHRVAKLCSMAVLMRPGDDLGAVRAQQAAFLLRYGLQSHLLDGMGLNLSSSAVREAVHRGEEIGEMVPADVAAHIHSHGLYL